MLPKIHITIERWRKNKEYGVYVSTLGRVKLLKTKEILEPRIGQNGYMYVFTPKGAKKVHRLVAYTWLGDHGDTCSVDHINSNTRDNRLCNLRWVPLDVNADYALFVKMNTQLEEKVCTLDDARIVAGTITDDVTELMDTSIAIEERVEKFLRLLNAGEIFVRYRTTIIRTLVELKNTKEKLAGAGTDTNFYTKVLNVANDKNKVYCGVQWKIQAVT